MTHEAFLHLVRAVMALARHAPPESDVHASLEAVRAELDAEAGPPETTDSAQPTKVE